MQKNVQPCQILRFLAILLVKNYLTVGEFSKNGYDYKITSFIFFYIEFECIYQIPPLKTKSIILRSTVTNLSCGILVYNVEKSKDETDFADLRAIDFLTTSKTGSRFWMTQYDLIPEK